MGGYSIKTTTGKDFFEVSSAFQKEVRRGKEKEALHWFFELWNSGFDRYCWKRMLYIVSEDIGLANNDALTHVWTLYQMYLWHKKEYCGDKDSKHRKNGDGAGKMFAIQALLILVRSPKCRIADDIYLAFQEEWFKNKDTTEIPDYALGNYTRRGKAQGRDIKYFYDEETKLEPVGDVPGAADWREEAFQISLFQHEHGGKAPSEMDTSWQKQDEAEAETTPAPPRQRRHVPKKTT